MVLLAAILLGAACAVAGFVVPGMRTLSVAGGTLLVFVVALLAWLTFLGLGVLGFVDAGGWLARVPGEGSGVLVLAPPLLPAAAFLLFFVFRAGRG